MTHRCSVRRYLLYRPLTGSGSWYAICLEKGCQWATSGYSQQEVLARATSHTRALN